MKATELAMPIKKQIEKQIKVNNDLDMFLNNVLHSDNLVSLSNDQIARSSIAESRYSSKLYSRRLSSEESNEREDTISKDS